MQYPPPVVFASSYGGGHEELIFLDGAHHITGAARRSERTIEAYLPLSAFPH